MKLNKLHKSILTGIVADLDFWTSADRQSESKRLDYASRRNITLARDGFVPLNLGAWLGRSPTRSDYATASRAYKRLSEAGLIETLNSVGLSDKTTHIGLTEQGREALTCLLLPPSVCDVADPSLVAPDADLKNPFTRG